MEEYKAWKKGGDKVEEEEEEGKQKKITGV
jgi:hypothetical protein